MFLLILKGFMYNDDVCKVCYIYVEGLCLRNIWIESSQESYFE